MSSPYELHITIVSAENLKNINWRHGPLKPYAVVWINPHHKFSTHVDEKGDESPFWDEKLTIPLHDPIQDSTLFIDIVHANAEEDTNPLIGSAKLKLKDVVDAVGIGNVFADHLILKRPSGRPHGKLEIKVEVKELGYRAPDPYYAPPPPQHYAPPPPYGGNYAYPAPPVYGGSYAAPPSGYPYPMYGQQPGYGGQQAGYGGQPSEVKKSKYGMGTGLAVGAAAGLLGGLAIAEGVDYVEDQIAEDVAEKVEDDLGYDVDDE